MKEADIHMRVAREEDLDEMATLVADVFSRRDPPAVVSRFSASKIKSLVLIFGKKSISEKLSIVAVSATTGAIVGAVMAHDFGTEVPGEIEQIGLESEPVIAMIDELEDFYRSSNEIIPGKFLHVFMIAVHDDWSQKGIAQQLIQSCLKNGSKLGYEIAFSEAANRVSQHISAKAGFEETRVSTYEDFEFQGRKPFETISDEVGYILMETELR